MAVEQVLRQVQDMARRTSPEGEGYVASFTVPPDVAIPGTKTIAVTRAEAELIDDAVYALDIDMRFEYMRDPLSAVQRLVAKSMSDRASDHVKPFVAQHARTPKKTNCVFPVVHLDLSAEIKLGDVRFLPLDHPDAASRPDLEGVGTCKAVVIAPCEGTHTGLMAARARAEALRALAALRTAMRSLDIYADAQLRTTIGEEYTMGHGGLGWRRSSDAAYLAPVNEETAYRIMQTRLSGLAAPPRSDVEKKASVALGWIDRAIITGDPLVAMLYAFFALEALLGRKDDIKKDLPLAYRRTILGEIVTGHFAAPEAVYLRYELVRSAAVHGSSMPEVSEEAASRFMSNVTLAVEEYLTFAAERKIVKRGKLLDALESDSLAPQVLNWLRERDPRRWTAFELTQARSPTQLEGPKASSP